MPLPPQPSSKAISRAGGGAGALSRRDDPTLPAILEFQSPSVAITSVPVPRSARGVTWIIASMFLALVVIAAVMKVDEVVTAQGIVTSAVPNLVLQPLDQSIVRSIEVKPGDRVKVGQVLARLDPTFAAADESALIAQVASLKALVARLQAEAEGRPFTYTGLDRDLSLQAAIYAQRQAQYNFQLEEYQQKLNSLAQVIARALSDATGYRQRLVVAQNVEQMRKELEAKQVGSRLNTLLATDNREEMARYLANAEASAEAAKRDLSAMTADRDQWVQSWRTDVSQQLADATNKLSDAQQSLNKAQLHRQLVELRAESDSTVLSIAKVSVGSVLQAGQEFITLVPDDAPLEVEAAILSSDNGYVHVGDQVMIKFAAYNYTQYGMAYGTVRTISPDSFNVYDDQRNPTGAMPPPGAAGNSGEPYYRARISIDRIEMHDTPRGFSLVPGMPVTSDILVGKRTLISYFMSRVMPVAQEAAREP
ncbi:MAG: HlyD family type I secretion periplasmic adaptor subunit [Proteobacteria bacterium]|nr:HlyD family type I secretion periplasmic adaptor subunit [Pseudomonadota bacterium]